jgi:prepilin-type N-terminal cleavage/methylation domain-containing protein
MFKGKGEKGMTLIELLLALAMVTAVGAGLFSAYWMANNAFEQQLSGSDVQYSSRTAMQWIVNDVLQLAKDSEENSIRILDEGKKLHLNVQYIKDEQIQCAQVEYYLDDNTQWFYRDESSKPALPIAENIENVNFCYNYNLDFLNIELMAEIAGHSFTLNSAVTPRVEFP